MKEFNLKPRFCFMSSGNVIHYYLLPIDQRVALFQSEKYEADKDRKINFHFVISQ